MPYILSSLPEDVRISMGYKIEDVLEDCKYAGKKCDYDKFLMRYDASMGNCYTFNDGEAFEYFADAAGETNGNSYQQFQQHNLEYSRSTICDEFTAKGVLGIFGIGWFDDLHS